MRSSHIYWRQFQKRYLNQPSITKISLKITYQKSHSEVNELKHFFHIHMYLLRCILITHWGRGMHICVINLTSIGSDNGLSPDRRHAIIRTNAGILLIGPLRTNFSKTLIKIFIFLFKKMHLKTPSGKWKPFCLGLNVLTCKIYSTACDSSYLNPAKLGYG